MIEIKFRVWDKSIPANTSKKELKKPTGMMIPWSYLKESSYLLSALNGKYPIMQYINKQDVNGTDVYDGDIILIHWSLGSEVPELISYDEKYGYWKYGNNPICELEDPHTKFEIVGNKYQNTEITI